jgi:hypothetical protein
LLFTQREEMQSRKYFTIEKCSPRFSRKIQLTVIGLCIVFVLLVLYSPFEILFRYFGYTGSNGCTLYTLMGVPCPACGMGHSLNAIFRGDTLHWFYYNPSAPVLYLLGFGTVGFVFVLAFFNYKIKPAPALYKLWYVAVIVLIIIWVLNILLGHH